MSKLFYEDFLKLKTARRLDKMKEARRAQGERRIANDTEFQRCMKQNQTQTREILFQLDSIKTAEGGGRPAAALHSPKSRARAVAGRLLRHVTPISTALPASSMSELAPLLQLYRLRLGDSLTIRPSPERLHAVR